MALCWYLPSFSGELPRRDCAREGCGDQTQNACSILIGFLIMRLKVDRMPLNVFQLGALWIYDWCIPHTARPETAKKLVQSSSSKTMRPKTPCPRPNRGCPCNVLPRTVGLFFLVVALDRVVIVLMVSLPSSSSNACSSISNRPLLVDAAASICRGRFRDFNVLFAWASVSRAFCSISHRFCTSSSALFSRLWKDA